LSTVTYHKLLTIIVRGQRPSSMWGIVFWPFVLVA
jgi:hypothetical protein